MPYIKQTDREAASLGGPSGEFNFLITQACITRANIRGHRYSVYNDIIGALECAKLEMYRRMVAPYEDKKIIENGDVYNGPTWKAKTASSPEELRSEGVEL